MREIHSWLMDMDGVLVREEQVIPGADRFLGAPARAAAARSSSSPTTRSTRRATSPPGCARSGLDVPEESIWTSALATARFLDDQRPGGSAFVIGEAGLTTALHEAGYTLTDRDPDYVVLGETRTYSFERITRAIRLIGDGRALHRHQPRPDRPVAGRAAAGDRLGRRADQPRHRASSPTSSASPTR